LANRRISRTKNFASYVNSINQDVSALKNQNAGGSISAGAISGDSLSETVTLFSSSIQSNNYSAGAAGWKIDGSGVAEFADVYVRGDINAQTGTIGYWNISPVDATRFIGPTKIFGTFLESDDIGVNDEEKTDGVYVSLFKSYFEDPKPITNIRRVSNEAIVTLPGHTLEVGDYVVVIVNEDTTFNTSTTGSLIVEVTADTFTYESVGTDFPVADPTTGITPSSLATGTAQYYQKDTAGIFVKDYGKKLLDYGYFSSDGVKYSSGSSLNAFLNPSFEYSVLGSLTYANSSWTSGGSAPSGGSVGSYDYDSTPIIYNVSGAYGQGYKWATSSFSNVSTNYLQGTIDYATAIDYRALGSGDEDVFFSLSGYYQGELSTKFTVNALAVTNTTTITITPANVTYAITAASSSGGSLTYVVSGGHAFSPGNLITVTGFSNTSYNISNAEITVIGGTTTFTVVKSVTPGSPGGTMGSATGIPVGPGDIIYLDFFANDTNNVDFTSDSSGNRFYNVKTTTTTTLTVTNYRAVAASGSVTLSSRLNYDGTSKTIGFYKLFSGRSITDITVPASTADITVTIPYHGLSTGDHIVLDASAFDDAGVDWLSTNPPPVRIVKTVPTANTITIHNPQYSDGTEVPTGTPVIGTNFYSSGGLTRPAAVYRIPQFRWNTSDVSFVFSNGNTIPLANVLDSTYKSIYWSGTDIAEGTSSSENNPGRYLEDALDVAGGASSTLQNLYQISSTLFDQSYTALDPVGKSNANAVYVRVPVVLEKAYFKDMNAAATSNASHIVYTVNSHPFIANNIILTGGFSSSTDDEFNVTPLKITSVTTNTITVPNINGASGTSTTIGYVYGYPSTNKTYVTSNSSNKNIAFIFDDFSFSKNYRFIYGDSGYSEDSWLDSTLAPDVASLNSPGDWINIDLETQSNYLSNVTKLTFSPSTTNRLLTPSGISPVSQGDGYSTDPQSLSIADENGLSLSSGVLSRSTVLGNVSTSSTVTPITMLSGAGVEIKSSRILVDSFGNETAASNAAVGVWTDSSYKSYFNVQADSVSFTDADDRPNLQSGVLIQNSGSTSNGYARSMYVTSGTNTSTSSTSFAEAAPAGYFETGASGAALIWYTMRADNSTSGITRGSFRIRYGLDADGNEVTNGAIVVDFSSTGRSLSMQGTNETTATNFYQFIGKPFTVYRIVFGQAVSAGTGDYFDKTIAVTPII
jgi:hypothetical protein